MPGNRPENSFRARLVAAHGAMMLCSRQAYRGVAHFLRVAMLLADYKGTAGIFQILFVRSNSRVRAAATSADQSAPA